MASWLPTAACSTGCLAGAVGRRRPARCPGAGRGQGTLLHVTGATGSDWYFANTDKGRQAVNDLLAGKWTPGEPGKPVLLEPTGPIFCAVRANIGPLTPLLAEQLMEAEKSYPAAWIEEAFQEAWAECPELALCAAHPGAMGD